jgi:hypothetical protein
MHLQMVSFLRKRSAALANLNQFAKRQSPVTRWLLTSGNAK